MSFSIRVFSLIVLVLALLSAAGSVAASEKKSRHTKGSESSVQAGGSSSKSKTKLVQRKTHQRDQEIVFDGTAINGRYLTSGEAVSTVEQEKNLNNLMGWRKNFKDRLTTERVRLAKEQGQ